MKAEEENKTTEQVTLAPNPTGKGGFGDHPENRNPGGWKKETVFSYQYRRFMSMTLKEWQDFLVNPPEGMTVVEELAMRAVMRAKISLPDVKEITDRTEGKAPQTLDLTSGGETLSPVVRIIDERPARNTNTE